MLTGFCLHFFHAFLRKHKICLHNCHNSLIYCQVCFAQILNRSQARSNWVQSQLWHCVANLKTNLSKLWKMKCFNVEILCDIQTPSHQVANAVKKLKACAYKKQKREGNKPTQFETYKSKQEKTNRAEPI